MLSGVDSFFYRAVRPPGYAVVGTTDGQLSAGRIGDHEPAGLQMEIAVFAKCGAGNLDNLLRRESTFILGQLPGAECAVELLWTAGLGTLS